MYEKPTLTERIHSVVASYMRAEGKFDSFLVLIGTVKYTLLAFVVWSGFCIWLGSKL